MSYHFVTGDFQPQKVFLPDKEYGLALDALVKGCADVLLTRGEGGRARAKAAPLSQNQSKAPCGSSRAAATCLCASGTCPERCVRELPSVVNRPATIDKAKRSGTAQSGLKKRCNRARIDHT